MFADVLIAGILPLHFTFIDTLSEGFWMSDACDRRSGSEPASFFA